MSQNLIKIKVINLERRFDRLKTFIIEMDKHDVKDDYEKYNAVDGKYLSLDEETRKMFTYNKFNWRKGVIGCALSHYNIWKELIESDFKYYLILEDDIKLTENFNKNYTIIKRMIKMCNYPLIYLGYTTDPSKKVNIQLPTTNPVISTLINKKEIWGGTFAYIIHRDMAQKFIDKIDKRGIRDPIDVFMMSGSGLHETIPRLITSPVMTSFNNADSDIQYDTKNVSNETFMSSILEKYDFYPKLDSPGNDIKCLGRINIKELVKIADLWNDCIAFNTYGCFKNKIIDTSKLIALPMATNKDGLFVKKKINK